MLFVSARIPLQFRDLCRARLLPLNLAVTRAIMGGYRSCFDLFLFIVLQLGPSGWFKCAGFVRQRQNALKFDFGCLFRIQATVIFQDSPLMLVQVLIDSANVLFADIWVYFHPKQIALDHLESALLLYVLLSAFVLIKHTLLSAMMTIQYTEISNFFHFQRDEKLTDIGSNLGYALIWICYIH